MYSEKFLTPATCRAARALLGWSQQELADRSGVGRVTIADYERGKSTLQRGSVHLLVQALASYGVIILREGGQGVMLQDGAGQRRSEDDDGEGGGERS